MQHVNVGKFREEMGESREMKMALLIYKGDILEGPIAMIFLLWQTEG